MVDFETLEVQAEVPETSLAAVKLGAAARIYLDAYPEKPFQGRVDRIWPTANRTKATVEVRVTFEERDGRLRPEMGVRVVFAGAGQARAGARMAAQDGSGGDQAAGADADSLPREDPKLLVPVDAVVKQNGAAHVFVVERDIVKLRPI